jgi:hypothetical protein
MKVLEFKHHAPFDGCFWRWEYIPFDDKGAYNVSADLKWPYRQSIAEVLEHGLKELDLPVGDYEWSWQYDTFSIYEWDRKLYKCLPGNWFPVFAEFAENHGLEFWWHCENCGKETCEYPYQYAGYHGNGGVGVEIDGWLCEDCVALEEEEEEEEEESLDAAE